MLLLERFVVHQNLLIFANSKQRHVAKINIYASIYHQYLQVFNFWIRIHLIRWIYKEKLKHRCLSSKVLRLQWGTHRFSPCFWLFRKIFDILMEIILSSSLIWQRQYKFQCPKCMPLAGCQEIGCPCYKWWNRSLVLLAKHLTAQYIGLHLLANTKLALGIRETLSKITELYYFHLYSIVFRSILWFSPINGKFI